MNLARGVITIGLSLYFSATSASKLALSDAKASSASNRNTEQMVSYVQAKLSAGSGACGKMAPQAASLLEQGKAAESGGVGVHIAAVGEYEDDDQLVWVGLNIHKLDFLGECVAPPCVSMCWCDDGPFLSVRGFAYKITSIMQNGNSLCMGKCNIYDKLATDLARGTNEYVIQIAQLQNAPIRLRTVPLPEPVNLAAAGGPLHYNVEFLKGDMGILVPGWICINCQHGIGAVGPETPIPSPLSLWVSDLNVGCISGIATSTEGVSPITRGGIQSIVPKVRTVTLGADDGSEGDTFSLPMEVPDESVCLAHRVMSYLRGGDAVVQVCPGQGNEPVTPDQLQKM
eukprot:TRINITY_DN17387_c0_g1_i1.p1 TRINITY_DN17387_c0_g1~~TRINITY_DN17387_c0_g1_i1.p1  ORF type:complete len:342 (-),score=44.23 TRINITY_DN17387_c0_g1_i1:127-1152(-)